jgi:predicted nucleotidyltransferase
MEALSVDIDRREKALVTMNVKGLGYGHYKELLGSFLDLLKENFGNRLLSFVLYGSVARGEAREDSDIDLLIILDNFFSNRLKKMKERLKVLGSKRIQLQDGTWYWDIKPDLKFGEIFTL